MGKIIFIELIYVRYWAGFFVHKVSRLFPRTLRELVLLFSFSETSSNWSEVTLVVSGKAWI